MVDLECRDRHRNHSRFLLPQTRFVVQDSSMSLGQQGLIQALAKRIFGATPLDDSDGSEPETAGKYMFSSKLHKARKLYVSALIKK